MRKKWQEETFNSNFHHQIKNYIVVRATPYLSQMLITITSLPIFNSPHKIIEEEIITKKTKIENKILLHKPHHIVAINFV